MKTIVHLITGLEVGGAEQMLQRTLPHLNRWKHTICSLSTLGPIGESLRSSDLSVEALGIGSPVSPASFARVVRFLRRVQPDLLQTYLVYADVLGVLASRPAGVQRVVVSVRSKLNEPKFWPVLAFYRLAAPLVRSFLFNSSATAAWYRRRGIVSSNFAVIPNGVEAPVLQPVADRAEARRALGLPGEGPLVVSVAKLRKEKGHRYLLEAVSKLVRPFPSLSLALVGTGPLEGRLRREAAALGIADRVSFLGNRTDVWRILRSADAFVLSSFYEGMSNALLEAMTAETPIVATDLPENRTLVGPDAALLVPRRDSTAIASALREILADPNAALGRAKRARRSVERDFSIGKTVASLETFYASLLPE